MKSIITKISLLITFLLVLTGSRCQTLTEPSVFYVKVANSSNITLLCLQVEAKEYKTEKLISEEWILSQKQFDASGDLFPFRLRESTRIMEDCRVKLLNTLDIVVVDTILKLGGDPESAITYLLKYKADKTLELETIVKPL